MYYRQLVKNLILGLIITSSSIASSPALSETQPDSNNCSTNAPELSSKVIRHIQLETFGLSLKFPANYRAIALTDGSVKIVDNGTYKAIVCSQKIPGYMIYDYGQYHYWLVKKSKENFVYSNVYDKIPSKKKYFYCLEENTYR